MDPATMMNDMVASALRAVLSMALAMWPLWLLMLGLIVVKKSVCVLMKELAARRG